MDQTWEAVKTYQTDVMKVKETDEEKLYFDNYSPADLEHIIETQHKVILFRKTKALPSLFCVGNR